MNTRIAAAVVAGLAATAQSPAATTPPAATLVAALPHTNIPTTRRPVTVDGEMTEPAWREAAKVGGFHLLRTGDPPAAGTTVLLLADESNLYVGFHCDEPRMTAVVARYSGHDEQTWTDDSVEVLIAPDPDGRDYFHAIASIAGGVFDERTMDPSWNGEWQAAVKKDSDGWDCEMRLSRRSFGLAGTGAGRPFGMNLCRNRRGTLELSSWSPMGSTYLDPFRFGTAHFGPALPLQVQMSNGVLTADGVRPEGYTATWRLVWQGERGGLAEATADGDTVTVEPPEAVTARPDVGLIRLSASLTGPDPGDLLGYGRFLFRLEPSTQPPQSKAAPESDRNISPSPQ